MSNRVLTGWMCLGFALAAAAGATAGEVGFLETFSLADDRAAAVAQLIPGTEEYYYFHCLHYQQQGDLAKARDLLDQWIKRYNYTGRVEELRNRQALLEYDKNPQAALDLIKQRLQLRFDHQKVRLDQPSQFPTALAADLVSRDAFAKRAMGRYQNLNGFEDTGLFSLAGEELTPDRRRDLLRRLERPDYPDLAERVVEDLRYKNSGGFGEHAIHRELTLAQLDDCRKRMPELINNPVFVETCLARLRPNEDVRWDVDRAAQRTFLEGLWSFAATLPPVQNSLKAHVLYRLLVLDQAEGRYERARFLEYIKLPRDVFYINRDYMARREVRDYRAALSADFHSLTRLEAVANDEPLVRDCLQHFLLDAPDHKAFAEFIDETYLKEVFAEAKILNGIGDMEQWYALMPPARHEALKERVDLDFLPVNKVRFAVDEPVALDVAVKNVATLIVKTYEINTFNYYRKEQREISTAIDLDGLVANKEGVFKYAQAPLRRHVERFEFPQIDRPGVFVIELIGNGRSSRAVVRKGRHTIVERTGSAGHVFGVFDDADKRIDDAVLWVAGHEYRAEKSGEIIVPFSTQPGDVPFIVQRGDFASLHTFHHLGEEYGLSAGFACDRESLIEGLKSRVLVRPELTVNGVPVDVALLEDVRLTIASVDRDGVAASQDVSPFELKNDAEAVHEFMVPENLASLTFRLSGKVESLTMNRKIDLSAERVFGVSSMDATDKVEMPLLRHEAGRYVLELRGKNGEPRAGRAVQLEVKHRDFRDTVNATLQTDAAGRVALGELSGVAWIAAQGPEGTRGHWDLPRGQRSYPGAIHALAGAVVRVPLAEPAVDELPGFLSVLEVRGGHYVRDVRPAIRCEGGHALIEGLTPGDYSLLFRASGDALTIRVTDGRAVDRYLLSPHRCLQAGGLDLLQIGGAEVAADGKRVDIGLSNAGADTRVHVLATRYVPSESLLSMLGAPAAPVPEATERVTLPCWYLSGRNIGDEYRYVLERKYAGVLPGNMLKRPSLLLAPWSLRKTETRQQLAQAGEGWEEKAYAAAAPAPMAPAGMFKRLAGQLRDEAKGEGGAAAQGDFANLSFLADGSVVMANLKPDAQGHVRLDAALLGPRSQLHVLAIDGANSVYRELSVAPGADTLRDRRLAHPLDPGQHYAEQKTVTCLQAGELLVIDEASTTTMEVYDTLGRIHGLFSTLSGDVQLAEFSFVANWPELPVEQKRELYSRHACHELNLFLFFKDPAFFAACVKPFIANKRDKTFVDHWLLEDDLGAYLAPWTYGRLNIVERVLLGRRVAAEREAAARHVADRLDLVTPDVDRLDLLFLTALKGSALDVDGGNAVGIDLVTMPEQAAAPNENLRRSFGLPATAAPREEELLKKAKVQEKAESLELNLGESDSDAAAKDGLAAAGKPMNGVALAAVSDARADRARRRDVRRLFRQLDKTEEWVENNYSKLPIDQQGAALINVNGFWRDMAAGVPGKPFLSSSVAEATGSFAEMMLALAVLDLPFKAGEHATVVDGRRLTLKAGSPAIVFHKEIRSAEPEANAQPVLVSQNVFAANDRYRHEGNERFDKFVTDEFEAGRVYGCQVVLTNPTSTRRKVDVLLQIPGGSIPVSGGFVTRSLHRVLEPYGTQSMEYFFYFPLPGDYAHYPVHVAQAEKFVASVDAFTFHVVDKLTKQDTTSWAYLSQNGTDDEVLGYLREHNVERLDLSLIAFRMRDKGFFVKALALLRSRHAYSDTLWAYSVLHNEAALIREYLPHTSFADACGPFIESPLLSLDPVARHGYQHKEYWPLVNARVYQLGRRRQILNDAFYEQYTAFLTWLSYRPTLGDEDRLALVAYLLLQDRVDDAVKSFARIDAGRVLEKLQYDYLKAYLALYREQPAEARALAARYADYPVPRWQNLFREVLAQVDEIEGRAAGLVDKEDRDQVQAQLAQTSSTLELDVENRQVTIRYQNLASCRINYYRMDIELLFSRNPFVQDVSDQFSVIRPNASVDQALPKGKAAVDLPVPAEFRDSNVMIEVSGGGITRRKAYYPHSLGIQIIENYGQVRVASLKDDKPLAKAYVKVYARMKNGAVQFYKDGYTDLRGRFDYASLSTDDISNVDRLSLLIMSEQNGAVVREAVPPKM